MTAWKHHHPPHDHPDFDAYLDALTDDELAAINAATRETHPDRGLATPKNLPDF
jgi:hypothetical protein